MKNVPRDWLLDEGRVAAVIHHGDAGTTAVGLSKGLPTVVVPLSGDQIFWGNMIEKAGAGPAPLSPENLTIESLATAIVSATTPSARSAARDLANKIYKEVSFSWFINNTFGAEIILHRTVSTVVPLASTTTCHWMTSDATLIPPAQLCGGLRNM